MGWNGSGGYTRTHNFSADGSAGIKILATRMDAEFNDFASAMTLALTRNGQNSPNANINMGGYRFTNVGAAASAEDFARVKEQIIRDIPIFVSEGAALTNAVKVSVGFYASVSAGQSPPDGSRIRVRALGIKNSASCDMQLHTPLNTSAGAQPHIAPIYSRGRKFDPGAIRSGQTYDLIYNASASAWNVLNPSHGYYTIDGIAKVYNAAGTVVGRDAASVGVAFVRRDSYLAIWVGTTASVSCSVSGAYVVLSCHGISAITSATTGQIVVPVMVKDAVSPNWFAKISQGSPGNKQLLFERAWNIDGTTVSAACTVKIAPNTYVFTAL